MLSRRKGTFVVIKGSYSPFGGICAESISERIVGDYRREMPSRQNVRHGTGYISCLIDGKIVIFVKISDRSIKEYFPVGYTSLPLNIRYNIIISCKKRALIGFCERRIYKRRAEYEFFSAVGAFRQIDLEYSSVFCACQSGNAAF